MVNKSMIVQAAEGGLPALTELINKLSKEDALKAIGILSILGVGYKIIDAIIEIVSAK